jgi:hypothetical protein
MVEEKVKQLKLIHPELAAVAERIHEMDLKETVNSIVVAHDVMRGARGKALAVVTLKWSKTITSYKFIS